MATSKVVVIITIVATMALTLTITYESLRNKEINESHYSKTSDHEGAIISDLKMAKALKRVIRSRFLVESSSSRIKNPRAADHCHKDNEICYVLEGRNSTCCNNKCIDLTTDSSNCGACKNKCKFTESCCRGKCVNLAYDKRNCGVCGNKCMAGGYCIYGMCDYA